MPRVRRGWRGADFGGVEQGLGGHAAAQDAEAADFLAAFEEDVLRPSRQPCAQPRSPALRRR